MHNVTFVDPARSGSEIPREIPREIYRAADTTRNSKVLTIDKVEDDDEDRKRFFCFKLKKKQWQLAVLALIISNVAIGLIVFFVIVPAIFQSNVDGVTLSLNYMDIKSLPTDPKEREMDVEMSIHLEADAIASSSIDKADAFLYYEGKPFSQVVFPSQSVKSGKNSMDLTMRQKAKILDAEVFSKLSQALITETSVKVEARAKVKAHALGLSVGGLDLKRELTIKAFHQFDDPKVSTNNIEMKECTSEGYKMIINASMTNPAQVGMGGVGVLNLSVYHQDSYLGYAVTLDGSAGIPRGHSVMMLELTVVKSLEVMKAMATMVGGLLSLNAQFYVKGDNPYATKVPGLKAAFAKLNMNMPYKDGLAKVTINPNCDLLAIMGR